MKPGSRLVTAKERRYFYYVEGFRKALDKQRKDWIEGMVEKYAPVLVSEAWKAKAEWAFEWVRDNLNLNWKPGGFDEPDSKTIVLKTDLYRGDKKIETVPFIIKHDDAVDSEKLVKDIWNFKPFGT